MGTLPKLIKMSELFTYKRNKMVTFTESMTLLKLYKTNKNLKVTDFNRYMDIINDNETSLDHKLTLIKIEIRHLRDLI